MAEKQGRLEWENGKPVLVFRIEHPRTGYVERERIYSGDNRDGDRVPFEPCEEHGPKHSKSCTECKGHAEHVLGNIRGEMQRDPNFTSRDKHVRHAVIVKTLARYNPKKRHENEVKTQYQAYIDYRREINAPDPTEPDELLDDGAGVEGQRLDDQAAMLRRGYLDFFDGFDVEDLSQPVIDDWLSWMKRTWLHRPTEARGKPPLPTAEQAARGIRGFHKPKTRHHIVNDFLQFDKWLVQRIRVARRYYLEKPEKMPTLAAERAETPSIVVVERYLAWIPEEKRGIFLTRSIEGLRPEEARCLDVRHYNWETHELTVTRDITKTAAGVRGFQADDELAEWLEKWIPLEERADSRRPLFLNPNVFSKVNIASRRAVAAAKGEAPPAEDGRWKPDAEDRVHKNACTAIGAVDADGKPLFAPNVMGRHAAATHMLARTKQATGVHDIEAVRQKLGHTDARTTRTYVDVKMVDVATTRRLRPVK